FAGDLTGTRQMRREYEGAVPPAERFPGADHYWAGLEAIAANRWDTAATELRAGFSIARCAPCGRYYYAYSLDRAGQLDSALVAWEAALQTTALNGEPEEQRMRPFALLRVGELAADKGDKQKALAHLQRFTALWKDADGPLQPMVQRAKKRIADLTAESGGPKN
ncbi:MAG: hypothetical protein ABJC19_11785, partial [Gemmatimonadota bacterium]